MDGDRRDNERITILGSLTAETSFPFHLDSLHDLRLALGVRQCGKSDPRRLTGVSAPSGI